MQVLAAESAVENLTEEQRDLLKAAMAEVGGIDPEELRKRAAGTVRGDSGTGWLMVPVLDGRYQIMVRPLTPAEAAHLQDSDEGAYLVASLTTRGAKPELVGSH